MIQVKCVASIAMVIVCVLTGPFSFKGIQQADYAGVNEIGPKTFHTGTKGQPDNVLCRSSKFIGVIDGESPAVEIEGNSGSSTGPISISPAHMARMVAIKSFRSAEAGLLDGKLVNIDDYDKTEESLSALFASGLQEGIKDYSNLLEEIFQAEYTSMSRNAPDVKKILEELDASRIKWGEKVEKLFKGYEQPLPSKYLTPKFSLTNLVTDRKIETWTAINDFSANVLDQANKKLWGARTEYLQKFDILKRKVNSGVASVAVRVVGYKGVWNYFSKDPDPYLLGYQKGRSFVAVLRLDKLGQAKDKSKAYLSGYKMVYHSQHYSWDLQRLYPELSPKIRRSESIESTKKIEFKMETGDIVLVTGSTLVDNLSYAFIVALINYGLQRQARAADKTPLPAVKQDPVLLELVKQYLQKMGNRNTIKFAFSKVTENRNYKGITEDLEPSGLSKCLLTDFFPSVEGNIFSWLLNKFTSTCVMDEVKDSVALRTESDKLDPIKASVIKNFNAPELAEILHTANTMIRDSAVKGKESGKATEAPSFLSYRHIIAWKQMMEAGKWDQSKNPATFDEKYIQNLIEQGAFQPSQGDLTIFANILVDNNTEESKMVCTKIAGKDSTTATPEEIKKIIEEEAKSFLDRTKGVVSANQIDNNLHQDLPDQFEIEETSTRQIDDFDRQESKSELEEKTPSRDFEKRTSGESNDPTIKPFERKQSKVIKKAISYRRIV